MAHFNFQTIIILKILQLITDGLTLFFYRYIDNKSNFLLKNKEFSRLYLCNILISIISFFVFYNDIKTNFVFTALCFCFSYIILFIKTAKVNNGIVN